MLTIDNITIAKNNKEILSNLGFSLSIASTLVITGQNGVGKTSLLKVIAGISKAEKGKILWNEVDVENFRSDFNGDLQFLGHKNFLKPELTVLQNLKFYAKFDGEEMLLPSALRFFKLDEFANQKVKNLSCGWQKRVMLAKLICCPATIWLLDEPSTGLDEEGKTLLKGLIETRAKEDGLIIIATHDKDLFDLGVRINLGDYAKSHIY